MDKVNFNPFAEILVEDFLRQSGYIGESFNLLVADFLNQNTAVTGLEVTAQSVADMTVYVKPGRMYQTGQQGQLTANLDPALPITAAHPTYPRIDRICAQYKEMADMPETRNVMVDTVSRQVIPKTVMTRIAGSIYFMVVNGVAAPGPAAPTVPDGWVSLAQVNVRAAATSILQSDILDERPTLKSLATHTHTGGVDGAKIDYNSLSNKPVDYSRTWRAKQEYNVDDICYPKVGASYIYLECIQAGTTSAAEPSWPAVGEEVTDGTVRWRVRDIKSGGGVPIGTVMPFLATQPQPGWLALDTGAMVGRDTYKELWAWVQANAPLITETEWQAQAAVQSSVGYYSSGDGSTTFRLPRIVDFVRGSNGVRLPGTWQEDDLKSHVHTIPIYVDGGSGYDGAEDGKNSYVGPLNTSATGGTETRPKSISMLYCVKAFDAVTDPGLLNSTEAVNELLGKVNYTDFTGTNQNLSANGWQKLPGGLILQWGQAVTTSSGTVSVTFPIAFPNACLNVYSSGTATSVSTSFTASVNKGAITPTGCALWVGTASVKDIAYWAIGN